MLYASLELFHFHIRKCLGGKRQHSLKYWSHICWSISMLKSLWFGLSKMTTTFQRLLICGWVLIVTSFPIVHSDFSSLDQKWKVNSNFEDYLPYAPEIPVRIGHPTFAFLSVLAGICSFKKHPSGKSNLKILKQLAFNSANFEQWCLLNAVSQNVSFHSLWLVSDFWEMLIIR